MPQLCDPRKSLHLSELTFLPYLEKNTFGGLFVCLFADTAFLCVVFTVLELTL